MRLKGPENCGGFACDGTNYEPDEDGCIEVEDESAIALAAFHGFVQAADEPAKKRGRPRKAEGAED